MAPEADLSEAKTQLSKLFDAGAEDMSPFRVLYNLEVLSGRLMPTRPTESSLQFSHDFLQVCKDEIEDTHDHDGFALLRNIYVLLFTFSLTVCATSWPCSSGTRFLWTQTTTSGSASTSSLSRSPPTSSAVSRWSWVPPQPSLAPSVDSTTTRSTRLPS